MTKPWEETWTCDERGLSLDVEGGPNLVEINIGPPETARLRLAAAAPDMARVLLALEWSGRDRGDETRSLCPDCYVYEKHGTHAPDCALDAALRKAGVR